MLEIGRDLMGHILAACERAEVPNPQSVDRHQAVACQKSDHTNEQSPIHSLQAAEKPLSTKLAPDAQKVGGH